MPRGWWGGVGSTEVELLLRWVQRTLVASTDNGYMIVKYIETDWYIIIYSYHILRWIQGALVVSTDNEYMILKYIETEWYIIIYSYYILRWIQGAQHHWFLVLMMSMMMTIILVIMMLIFMIIIMMIILLCNDNTYLSPPPPRFLRSKGELSRVLMSWRLDIQMQWAGFLCGKIEDKIYKTNSLSWAGFLMCKN